MTDDARVVDFPAWTPVSDGMPDPGKIALAHITNSHGNGRCIRAMWAPRYSIESGDEDECNEYHEENDQYYLLEGWYETNEYDENSWRVHDPVTHWMPLPPAPGSASNVQDPDMVPRSRYDACNADWLAEKKLRLKAEMTLDEAMALIPHSVTTKELLDAAKRVNERLAAIEAGSAPVVARPSATPLTDALLARFKPSISDMTPLSQLARLYQALHDTERELDAARKLANIWKAAFAESADVPPKMDVPRDAIGALLDAEYELRDLQELDSARRLDDNYSIDVGEACDAREKAIEALTAWWRATDDAPKVLDPQPRGRQEHSACFNDTPGATLCQVCGGDLEPEGRIP